ncbi:MAG: ERAP1-like C-terminal domain-containing protein, partial [Frankiales bacterium]|nr:ERAP1-like C-terminal domain-containing protein [Frankiales bacterium]
YELIDGALVRTHREELDVVGATTEVRALVGRRQPDLILVNDDDLTFAKIRLDERSLQMLTSHVGDIAESLPRTLCWAALWDMTRDAEIPARDYLTAVLTGIGGESDIGVVQSLLRQAQSAITSFADPSWAPTGRALLADTAHTALLAAEPGSDLQLTWTRTFAATAGSPLELDRLRGLLDGGVVVAGLSIDTDLRWSLLARLVSLGAAGDAEIDAELERDRTSAGQRQAAMLRALRPTADAKAQAWQLAVEDTELPNAVQAAVIAGFWHGEQLDLLAPYVQRYFDVVGRVWQERSGEMAQNVIVGLFPSAVVSTAVVQATDAYLDGNDVPPAMARLLSEGRDGVVRSLRARERDAAAG